MSVLYQPGNANVVADNFSPLTMVSVSHVEEEKKELVKHTHRLARLDLRLQDSPNGDFMVCTNSDPSLVVEVKSKQHLDPLFMKLKENWYLIRSMSHSPKGRIVFLATKGYYVYRLLRI